MADEKLISGYHDLLDGPQKNTDFFFLENILKARIALNIDTGIHSYDEEVNVYVAYLLMSMVTSSTFLHIKPYVSAYDNDVRTYLERHPGTRTEYVVYKDNADYGLVAESVFHGHEHTGSYHTRVLSQHDDGARIAMYYEFAASALAHLTCANATLVHVLSSIAKNYAEIVLILRKVAGEYFNFIERLSEGTLFHLEKDVERMAGKSEYDHQLDKFLKSYYDYTQNPSEHAWGEVLAVVAELRKFNQNFHFDEKKLCRH